MLPGCVQRPRGALRHRGVTGSRAPRLAVGVRRFVGHGRRSHPGRRGPGSLPGPEGAAVVAAEMVRLDEACAAVDRDPTTLDRIVLTGMLLDGGLASSAAFEDTCAAYEEVGVTDLVVHWPRADGVYAGDEEAFEALFGVPNVARNDERVPSSERGQPPTVSYLARSVMSCGHVRAMCSVSNRSERGQRQLEGGPGTRPSRIRPDPAAPDPPSPAEIKVRLRAHPRR